MDQPVHLPVGHKFMLYLDNEGVYNLESQEEGGPIVDGNDANEAVARMIKAIPEWPTLDELSRGYVANTTHALKLYREFEASTLEILSRVEPLESSD